jgi:hypothetical protein
MHLESQHTVQRYMANNTASINPANVTLPADASLPTLLPLTMLGRIVVRAVAVIVAVPVVPDACAAGDAREALVGGLAAVVAGEATAARGRRQRWNLCTWIVRSGTYRCYLETPVAKFRALACVLCCQRRGGPTAGATVG